MTSAWRRLRIALIIAVAITMTWLGAQSRWGQRHDSTARQWRAPAPALPAAASATAGATRPGPTAPLLIPVAGVTRPILVDTFTQSRANGMRRHDAIDIMAPRGTPVIAAAPGRVEKLFLSKDGGNTIYIRSPDGRLIYYYAHLDAYAPGLAEGAVVAEGTALGTVGSTGNASPDAPHLHFAMAQADPTAPWYQQAPALNPYPLLMGIASH